MKFKSFVLQLQDSAVADKGIAKLFESSEAVRNSFQIERFPATSAEDAQNWLDLHGLQWSYPWTGTVSDCTTGLTKTAYPNSNRDARMACAVSHFRLWEESVKTGCHILILEHDAEFVHRFPASKVITQSKYQILGINHPKGATRRAAEFERLVRRSLRRFQPAPRIDSPDVPQGLAGGSAYVISPKGANLAIRTVRKTGLWPNDALLCAQLFPDMIGVTRKFYTRVQPGLPSTTTLSNNRV